MQNQPIVALRDVARTFGEGANAVVAVHGITFDVHRGDQIALTGPSGSGKTTLMHLIAGLDTPTTGSIEWPGIGTRKQLRLGPIAIVFQAPSLLPPLNAIENVALPLLLQGIDRRTARAAAFQALDRLGLQALATKLPEELSGGQAQRVAAARALAGNPQLILADEPTGQLDHATGALVIDALVEAAERTGAALIVNTHDRQIADRLRIGWSMCSGRLVHRVPALR